MLLKMKKILNIVDIKTQIKKSKKLSDLLNERESIVL